MLLEEEVDLEPRGEERVAPGGEVAAAAGGAADGGHARRLPIEGGVERAEVGGGGGGDGRHGLRLFGERPAGRGGGSFSRSFRDTSLGIAGPGGGAFGAAADLATQQHFFDAHLAGWAPRFFQDLEAAKAATFYMPVGAVGRHFMAIEMQAFALAA